MNFWRDIYSRERSYRCEILRGRVRRPCSDLKNFRGTGYISATQAMELCRTVDEICIAVIVFIKKLFECHVTYCLPCFKHTYTFTNSVLLNSASSASEVRT